MVRMYCEKCNLMTYTNITLESIGKKRKVFKTKCCSRIVSKKEIEKNTIHIRFFLPDGRELVKIPTEKISRWELKWKKRR